MLEAARTRLPVATCPGGSMPQLPSCSSLSAGARGEATSAVACFVAVVEDEVLVARVSVVSGSSGAKPHLVDRTFGSRGGGGGFEVPSRAASSYRAHAARTLRLLMYGVIRISSSGLP